MNEYSIDFSQMGNWRPEGIQTVPSWTLGQEGLDKAIDSLGNVLGVYTRKEAISKDPELESLKEQLEALVSRKSKLQNEIATIKATMSEDIGVQQDIAHEAAANMSATPKDAMIKAGSQGMQGYTPENGYNATRASEQQRGYYPTDYMKNFNVFG